MMRTHSLCPACYRHIPAELVKRDGRLVLHKVCPAHGETEAVVENDLDFIDRIVKHRGRFVEQQNVVVLDVTDKCNLKCAHCYHLPDNEAPNKPLATILDDVALMPARFSVILGGAEPSIRHDLPEVANALKAQGRPVGMLSNGIRFSDPEFAKSVAPLLDGFVLIGLNHRNYHGETIHDRQLAGLRHLREYGVRPMLGYTAEHAELPDILREALALHRAGVIQMVRLRFGASIGRHPELPAQTLSDHMQALQEASKAVGLEFRWVDEADNTIYNQMVMVAGMPVRVIQWPDERNMVMAELMRAPWAKFIDGPISNFCHQIVLRDGFEHKKLPQLDTVPAIYTLNGYLQQQAVARSPVPQLNVSSRDIAPPDYSNARYVEDLGRARVANLHGRMTPALRETITRFWLEQGAIPDEREAWRRSDEVVHLGFDHEGRIVAVNTCYRGELLTVGGPLPYWYYRIYVAPAVRSVRLSLGLFRLTACYLGSLPRGPGEPRGIAMRLENPKFYNPAGRRSLGWVGIKPFARDAQGAEIWTYDFDSVTESKAPQ